jgi:ubiquinone/menaquinone biosynthesis C-methylase UbiE
MQINHLQSIANFWDAEADHYYESHPEHLNRSMHPSWGLWHVPESSLCLLKDVLTPGCCLMDLGCGIGHDAAGFADLGATVLAVDLSIGQLKRSMKHPRVKHILAAAECLPVPDKSIDIAISDHGAFDHSPAPLLLGELNRVLKPGAVLVICTYSPLAHVCYDSRTRRIEMKLTNDYPSNSIRYDGTLVTTSRSYAEWVRVFRQYGFEVNRLEELRIPATSRAFFDELVDVDWASRWPTDILWVVRRGLAV